ncbi:MAG: hypothetical protein CMO63_03930 [Verrucomicrobiales bacterium]|nr:hypothetical protein [Verrucomicrobiales bacterium]
MKIIFTNRSGRASFKRAFTLLEMLVSVSVMTMIIYVLYALFDQTQSALRKNAAQVDVNEGGRAAMEMIVRELSQMEVSGYPPVLDAQSGRVLSGSKSFHSRPTPGTVPLLLAYQSDALTTEGTASDLAQGFRTNVLQDFTFTSRGELGFDITSYRVINVKNGIGTLGRYGTSGSLHSADPRASMVNKSLAFNLHFDTAVARPSEPQWFQQITDGVIHFKITAFDQFGRELMPTIAWPDPLGLNLERLNSQGQPIYVVQNDRPLDGTLVQEKGGESHAWFYGGLPAYFDVEMAVIEPDVLEQVRQLPTQFQANFLGQKINKVTLFRQRVPIRQTR